MKLVALFGSPRHQGISSQLHEAFLAPAEEAGVSISRVFVYDKHIHPCTGCGLCRDESRCAHSDAMTELYALLRSADALTVSSPVYFSALPGPLKNLIDRCQLFWEEHRRIQRRPAAARAFFIATAGSSYPGIFTPSATIMRHFLNTLGCHFTEADFFFLDNTDDLQQQPAQALDSIRHAGELFLSNVSGGTP